MPPTGTNRPFNKVLIAGAGPAGLLLALLLSQHGIPTLVLEAWDRLDERLRATQYGVPATRIFRRAGLLKDFRDVGIPTFPYICWRNVKGSQRKLTGIDLSTTTGEEDRMTVLPLNMILQIMYKHCKERGNGLIDIRFNHKVTDVGQDGEKAWADVVAGAPGEEKRQLRFEAGYVIGCDGGSSTVRKCLFGRDWPGETFDCKLMVQNVFYDGFEKHGWDGGNYMIDEEHFGLIAKRGKPSGETGRGDLWRVTYGDAGGLSDEELIARRPAAFKRLLPGNPGSDEYTITDTNQFRVHNRCVRKMREGRIILAADAAHVCNPFGGYGCMSAVLDAGGLADCLIGYYEGWADEDILDLYAKIRRDKFVDYVDRRSRKNFYRISRTEADTALETDTFLGILQGMEGDKKGTRDFLMKWSSIEYDFTQHYKKPTARI